MLAFRPDGPDVHLAAPVVEGSAWVRHIVRPAPPSRLVVEEVTFAPGSYTVWHSHPFGQLLLITGGTGWLQARDEPAVHVTTGDAVWIAPGEEHWHGSTPDTTLHHLAIQESTGEDARLICPLATSDYPPAAWTAAGSEKEMTR